MADFTDFPDLLPALPLLADLAENVGEYDGASVGSSVVGLRVLTSHVTKGANNELLAQYKNEVHLQTPFLLFTYGLDVVVVGRGVVGERVGLSVGKRVGESVLLPDLALALELVFPPFAEPAFPDLLPVGEYVGIYVVGSSVVGLKVGSAVVALSVGEEVVAPSVGSDVVGGAVEGIGVL